MDNNSTQPVKATPCAGGFVRADGVVLGKLVITPKGPALQVCDKDRRRSSSRGSRYVLVDLSSLAALAAIPTIGPENSE